MAAFLLRFFASKGYLINYGFILYAGVEMPGYLRLNYIHAIRAEC